MHKNADLVRRGYQAFNTADIKTLTELFAENASWHTPGRGSVAGDHVGREAVFGYFGRLGQETGGTFKADLRFLTTDDDGRVMSMHRNTAVRNGKRLDVECCLVFQIENGRVTDGTEHFYDLHAWDEFWS